MLKFVHVEEKPYWYDEVYTSLRLSGYTKVEIFEQVGTNRQVFFKSLQNFQCPNVDRNLGDVLNGLITDDSHPPLYFTLLYYWTKFFGCTVGKLRLFSVVLSILLIPIIYALIDEIFASQSIALLSTALISNSPIFLIYAQQARSYILFAVLALLSTLVLLKFLRNKKSINLIFYCLLSAAGLYCHTLHYAVIFSQISYCIILSSLEIKNSSFVNTFWLTFEKNKKIFLALFISILSFLLWILRVIYVQGFLIRIGADYTWKDFPSQLLWQRILLNLANLINDFENPIKFKILATDTTNVSLFDLNLIDIFLISLISLLFLYSIVYTLKFSDRSRTVLLGLLALPSLLFLAKDLLVGGSASTIIRYQLLSVFGLYACLSFFLVNTLKIASSPWLKGSIISLITLLIQLQIYSNFGYIQASTWWSTYGDYQIKEFASQVNQSTNSLVLADANYREMVNLLKLSYVLNSSVPFQLVETEKFSENDFKSYDIFWAPQI